MVRHPQERAYLLTLHRQHAGSRGVYLLRTLHTRWPLGSLFDCAVSSQYWHWHQTKNYEKGHTPTRINAFEISLITSATTLSSITVLVCNFDKALVSPFPNSAKTIPITKKWCSAHSRGYLKTNNTTKISRRDHKYTKIRNTEVQLLVSAADVESKILVATPVQTLLFIRLTSATTDFCPLSPLVWIEIEELKTCDKKSLL